VFASDILDAGAAGPGDAVRVIDPAGRVLGVAHYSSTSQIRLRLLSQRVEAFDRDFIGRRIEAARALRSRLISGTDAYRLVFGEADRLPGLVIDRYADYFVVQTLDQGMDRAKDLIANCIGELFSPAGVLLRNDASVRKRESLPLEVRVIAGSIPDRVVIHMNGLELEADLLGGQKTGVYLDQRENYLAAARYTRGRVLDCFTSSGGFALHLAGSASSVLAIDSSEAALETARRNAQRNRFANVEFLRADMFDFLAAASRARERFDTIVLDPPAFTKSRTGTEGAARGYREINFRALRLLAPGGVLVTCSCSQRMSEARLLEIIAAAALDAGRTLRVLERRTQSADHPILLTVPETHYLKCLILQAID
jgi:23S rRNA (cytosine1962-C5)-methyltransferase